MMMHFNHLGISLGNLVFFSTCCLFCHCCNYFPSIALQFMVKSCALMSHRTHCKSLLLYQFANILAICFRCLLNKGCVCALLSVLFQVLFEVFSCIQLHLQCSTHFNLVRVACLSQLFLVNFACPCEFFSPLTSVVMLCDTVQTFRIMLFHCQASICLHLIAFLTAFHLLEKGLRKFPRVQLFGIKQSCFMLFHLCL